MMGDLVRATVAKLDSEDLGLNGHRRFANRNGGLSASDLSLPATTNPRAVIPGRGLKAPIDSG